MKNDKSAILTDSILNIGYHSFGRKPVVWKAYQAFARVLEVDMEVLMEPEFNGIHSRIEKAVTLSREAAGKEESIMDEVYTKFLVDGCPKVERAQERARQMYEQYTKMVEYEVENAVNAFPDALDRHRKVQNAHRV